MAGPGAYVKYEDEVVVAVMGVTGAGKSSLISLITGRKDIAIGKGLRSQTQSVTSYKFRHKGTTYILVDTPGFNDTRRGDPEILEEIVTWLATKYSETTLLSGIIYLHPISEPRIQGSTMTQMQVFKHLCGPDFYTNVILATTFWETMDQSVAERRERELFSTATFLGDMRAGGSLTSRITRSRSDALMLIEHIAQKQKGVMKVQKELSKNGSSFAGTQAAKALSRELLKLSKRFEQRLKVARRLPLHKKALITWNEYKHEKAAKALARANLERETITFQENESKRARVRLNAEERRKVQKEREAKIKSEAEEKRREYNSRMNRLGETLAQIRLEDERLRREEEEEKQARIRSEKKRAEELHAMNLKKINQQTEESQREKRVRDASRNRLEKNYSSFFWWGVCRQPGCGKCVRSEDYYYCSRCKISVCVPCWVKENRIFHMSECRFE